MTPTRLLSRRALSGVAALSLSLGGAVGALVVAAGPAAADTITVTNTADDGSATSLRGVLESSSDGDVIVLTPGATYQLALCNPPAPSATEGSAGWGDVEITGAVTIQGDVSTIEQTCPDRVLYTQKAITLQGVRITGGDVDGPGGGLFQDSNNSVVMRDTTFTDNTATGGGGGLATSGDVTATNVIFSLNHDTGSGDGGGIKVFAATGTTTIADSTFVANTTTGWGGAFEQQGRSIVSQATGGYALQVTSSLFRENTAGGDGGGALDTEDPASIGVENSTFTGNSGGWGGGIGTFGVGTNLQVFGSTFNLNGSQGSGGAVEMSEDGDDTAAFVDSTITGNSQGSDGAINVDGIVDLRYVTITNNSNTGEEPIKQSSRGPRTAVSDDNNAANLSSAGLESFGSVVAQPIGGPNCEIVGYAGDAGYNFSDDTSPPVIGSFPGSCGFTAATSNVKTPNDPVLGSLTNNGGPTQTLLPLTGGLLLDAIPPSVCSEIGVTVDQRGITRPQGPGCDIGAVEVQVSAPAPSPAAIVTPKFTG